MNFKASTLPASVVVSVGKYCKQCGPRCWSNKTLVLSGSNFDTLMVLLKEFFKRVDLNESTDVQQNNPVKLLSMQ